MERPPSPSVWPRMPRRAWTEESRADPDHRRALLHGHLQVVRHPHRPHLEVEVVSEAGEGGEAGSSALRWALGADAHEPPDHQSGGSGLVDEGLGGIHRAPALL